MFLDKIVQTKRQEIVELKKRIHPEDWRKAKAMPPVRSLSAAIKKDGNSIIAEVKPASPSKGVIRKKVNPVEIAKAYELGGASAISVLTDRTYFQGENRFLTRVKEAVRIPVLRKDFILDECQLVESRLIGADAVLLIVAILEREQCRKLAETAHELGLEVLVEIHKESEMETALSCGADVIGINNRNLSTFHTDLSVTEQLRPLIKADCPVITESGIHSVEDIQRMQRSQVDGMLIGEYLMRQDDHRKAVEELIGGSG
jgi:indole-3-glycerol phosphate synthase